MSSWTLSRIVKGMRPLAVLPDGVIFYRRGAVYKAAHDLSSSRRLFGLPAIGFMGWLANYFRLIDRIFRLSPTHALVFDNSLFIARRSEIWRYDFSDCTLSLDFRIPDERRSLDFSLIVHGDSSTEIVFGEYFSNPHRLPVRIWGRKSGRSVWEQRAEFEEGEIEHVHAVRCMSGQVYVLTGDFGDAAAIWSSDVTFSALKPLARGRQAFRAAWMETLGGRLYMATDTQLEQNQLFDFQITEEGAINLLSIADLSGSSIYAGNGSSDIFFSTTVECGEPTGNFILDIFDKKLGPGVLSNYSSIMVLNDQGDVMEIYAAQKDAFPFRLGQFGSFLFPTGVMPHNTLFAYGVALQGVDDACLIFHIS